MVKDQPRIQSNSGKLTGWLTTETGTSEQPVVVTEDHAGPTILREEDEDSVINLDDIPEAGEDVPSNRSRKRPAREVVISSGSDTDDSFQFEAIPSAKRSRKGEPSVSEDVAEGQDDKKKLGLNTSYDGFSIYGRILCLIVKRKGPRTTGGSGTSASSQHMLENWVSTQAAAEQVDDDDGNG